MRIPHVRPLPALLAALLLLPAGLRAGTEGALKLGFRADREAVLAEAASSGRQVLAFFTTDWCSWCRRLEADVFADPAFQAGSADWLKLVVDAEKGGGVDYAKAFHVSGYPTIVLLGPDGSEIDRVPGYLPMPDFLATFRDYARGVGTLDALQERLAAEPGDLALKLEVAGKLGQRGRVEDAERLLQEIVDADPTNASGRADDAAAELAMNRFRASRDEQVLEDLLLRWPKLDQGPEIYNTLVTAAARRDDHQRMHVLLDRAVEDYPDDADLLNAYAWTSTELGWDLDRALELARRAERLSDGEPGVLDTVAEIQFRQGDREGALATIARALAKRPGDEYLLKQQARFRAGE